MQTITQKDAAQIRQARRSGERCLHCGDVKAPLHYCQIQRDLDEAESRAGVQ